MAHRRKVALVTGSAKGLGRMTAQTLAEAGCDIAIHCHRSDVEAEQFAAQIRSMGGAQAAVFQADITDSRSRRELIEHAVERFGAVDILVNNVGPFVRERRRFLEYTTDEIRYLMEGNLLGVMELDHLVLPHMRRNRFGRIIHFGFAHAGEARAWPHRAVYAAAKVGLVSFTRTLAVEEAEFGITVNMICPGDIRGTNKEKAIEEVRGITDEEVPIGRPGSGEDIARTIAYLCDERSDFITGSVIDVTGGFDPIRPMPPGLIGPKA